MKGKSRFLVLQERPSLCCLVGMVAPEWHQVGLVPGSPLCALHPFGTLTQTVIGTEVDQFSKETKSSLFHFLRQMAVS